MRLSSLREFLAILALGAVLAVLLTYPLAFKIDRVGRLDNADGYFALWNVAWVARTLVLDPWNVYHANIFYPHPDTLAFSEANLGAGVLAIPAYWATRNPFVAHNVTVLVVLIMCVLGGYYFVRRITQSRHAALIAAIAFAFCPYYFAHFASIQLLMTAGLPLCLLTFHRFIDQPVSSRAVVMAFALAAQALSCAYFGVFAGLTIGLGVLFYAAVRGLWRRATFWLNVALAAGLTFGLILPFFLPYLRLQRDTGFERTLADATMWSADWRSYLASSAYLHRWMLPLIERWNEVLFPGFIATCFGIVGVGLALGRGNRESDAGNAARNRSTREAAGFYLLLGVLAFWTSLGPDAGLYSLLYYTVPVFDLLRAPGRTGIMVALALAVLSGIGIERLLRNRSRLTSNIVTGALGLATVAELTTVPLFFREAQPTAKAYEMLAALPPGSVTEFPFFYTRPDFPRHAMYMFNSTTHWKPLVNGYSDYIPLDFRRMALPLSTFPSRDSFNIMKQRRVRYVVLHLDLYDRRSREKLIDGLTTYAAYLMPLLRDGEVWLYEITAWPE